MRLARLSAIACVLSLPAAAFAVPVSYEFSGQFGGSSGTLPTGFPDPLLPYGTAFFGYFTVETSTPASFENANLRQYNGAIVEADISLGENGALGGHYHLPMLPPVRPGANYSSNVSLLNDLAFNGGPPTDQVGISVSLSPRPDDPLFSTWIFSLSAQDYAGATLLADGHTLLDDLPVDRMLASSPLLSFGITQYDANGQWLDEAFMHTTSFSLRRVPSNPPTSVPEPGTFALLGLGLLVLLARRREPVQPRLAMRA